MKFIYHTHTHTHTHTHMHAQAYQLFFIGQYKVAKVEKVIKCSSSFCHFLFGGEGEGSKKKKREGGEEE